MKKKVLAMVLTLTLALSVTACGGSKKEDKKEDAKKQETQVGSEEQEVSETPEELNEYGVTDGEMQLLLDRFKEKIKENEEFYKKAEENDEGYEGVGENGILWPFSTRRDLLDAKVWYASLEEIWNSCFECEGVDYKENKDLETVFYKSVKEWQEEDNISEKDCIAFLGAVIRDWETFKDTYLVPAYDEVMGH